MLSTLWLPSPKFEIKIPYPFVVIGAAHSFVSSIFAFGGILQATMARLRLARESVVANIAACFAGMGLMKTVGYATYGFDYRPYVPVVLAVTLGTIPGAILGRRLGSFLSQRGFNIAFRLIVTAFAIRLIVQSLTE